MKTPHMQRRHFEFIAETILRSNWDENTRMKVATEFAGRLRLTNANFDTARFIEAAVRG